jgi:hypothetical protein
MPVTIRKRGDRYSTATPGGVKAKGTTHAKAKAQARLLEGIEHGWKPTGKPGYLARKRARLAKE